MPSNILMCRMLVTVSMLFSLSALAQVGRTTVDAAANAKIVIWRGSPILCVAQPSYIDCLDERTFGDLHNAGLRATFGPRPATGQTARRPDAPAPTVSAITSRLDPWMASSEVMATQRGLQLTRQIIGQFQAAGVVDREGRFSREALGDPLRVITYLEKSGRVSNTLATTLRELNSRNAPSSEWRDTLRRGRWLGRDRLAAAIIADVMNSSSAYWGTSASRATGLWDALGTMLTLESGPGAIIGGLVMSAASCWCLDF
jgi:hypothetical protein